MGGNFLPAFREPTVLVAMTTAPGTSLKQTRDLADTAQDLLLKIPEVETVGYRLGRAERGDHVVPVSTVEFDLEFTRETERERSEIIAENSRNDADDPRNLQCPEWTVGRPHRSHAQRCLSKSCGQSLWS